MRTKFSDRLSTLINTPAKPVALPNSTIKIASTGDITVDGIRKIANILRTTSVEPSYVDVYAMYSRIKQ
jgi:hypothetical protein